MQDLDRDVAGVAEVVREVDRRHAALPELALDAVAVGQRLAQFPRQIGHHGPRHCG